MSELISPQLRGVLMRIRDSAHASPGGPEEWLLKKLSRSEELQAPGRFPCLRCHHAAILVDLREASLAVGVCKKFVALPRVDEFRPGFKLIDMHCTAAAEPAEGAGSWDDFAEKQLLGAGHAERQRKSSERP